MSEGGEGIGRRGFNKAVAGTLVGTGLASRASVAEAQSDTSAGEEIWRIELNQDIEYPPTVVEDTVYIGNIAASDGAEKWRFETENSVIYPPTVADGIVYAAGGDKLYAVHSSDGTEEWVFDAGGEVMSPVVVDGVVYIGSTNIMSSDNLRAVNASDGTNIWSFDVEPVGSSPTVADGTVYIGSQDANLYAVNASDGTEKWSFETGHRVESSPTVAGGTVYFGSGDSESTDGNLYAVDATAGSLEWDFAIEDVENVNTSPTVANGTVYFGAGGSYASKANIYAVNASDGSEEWSFGGTKENAGVSSPTVADGTLYFGSNDGNLYALNASDGSLLWSFETDSSFISSPIVVDGVVYFGSRDRVLYAVDAGVSGSSDGSRVMLGTLGHHGDWRYANQSIDIEQSNVDSTDTSSDEEDAKSGTEDRDSTDAPVFENQDSITDDSGYTDNPTEDSQDVDLVEIAGAVGALGLVGYGGYRLVSSADEEKKDTQDDKDRTPTSTTTPRTQDTKTIDVDGKLNQADGTLSRSEKALEACSFQQALKQADDAVDTLKELQESVDDREDEKKIRTKLEEAHRLRERIETEKDSYERVKSEIDEAESRLDVAETSLSDEKPRKASNRLESLSDELEDLREDAAEYDLEERVRELQKRHGQLRERAKEAVKSSAPESVPSPPRLSLEYDDIEQGEVIGTGGNADVYHAEAETNEGRMPIALKEPRVRGSRTLNKETVERFIEEAETWDKLDDHENIVGIIDYNSEPLPWIALEYMDGGELGIRTDASLDEKLWIATQVCEGVIHAHRRGVVHLDLKPENILFRETDEEYYDVPKVADWGLAKMLLEHSKSMEGLSPHYAAPEQFDKEEYGEPNHETDVYQLGAVFYELFTGQPPFEGGHLEVMNSIQNEEPKPPSEINLDLPEKLDEILLTCLAKDRNERYESVLYLRDELEGLRNSR